MSSKQRQTILNTLTGWGSIAARGAIALLIIPLLLGAMGPTGYGVVAILGVLVSLSLVADMGLRQALGRELTEQRVTKNWQAFDELMNSALAIYMLIGLSISVALILLAPTIAVIANIPDSHKAEGISLIRIAGSGLIILSFITPLFTAGLASYHRFDLIGIGQVAGDVITASLLVVMLKTPLPPLYSWAASAILGSLSGALILYWSFCRYGHTPRFGTKYLRFDRLKPLFRLSGHMYALQMTSAFSQKSDPIVIAHFFGPAGVAVYQPASKISTLLHPIVLALSNQMYPLATEKHLIGNQAQLQKILVMGTKWTIILGILFCVGMFFWATPFCRLWLGNTIGDGYKTTAKLIMAFAFVDLMTYAAGTQWPVLLGMKKLRFLTWTQLPSAVVNLLVSTYLVGFTEFGILGAVIATAIIGFIRRPILIWYTASQCGLEWMSYLRESYARPAAVLAVTAISAWALSSSFNPATYLELAFCALLTGVAWLISVVTLGVNPNERRRLRTMALTKVSAFFQSSRGALPD